MMHHHRCYPDDLSVAEATEAVRKTWTREPLFHISSPLEGVERPGSRNGITTTLSRAFSSGVAWLALTVEVEAKAKG